MKSHLPLSVFALSITCGVAATAIAQVSPPGQPAIELLAEIPALSAEAEPVESAEAEPVSEQERSTPKLPANPSDQQILEYAATMRAQLLASPDRLGYGANTTGGDNPVIVRDWEQLREATRTAGNYVIIAPDAEMPMIADQNISIRGPNITIDGSLVPGGPVVQIDDFTNPTYALVVDGGNFILHNMKFIPEVQGTDSAGVMRIRRGENYWIDHYEVEGQFKDDALSLGQRNSGQDQATNITISNYKVHNTVKGLLVSGLIHTDRTIYYTVHKSYLNGKDRNPRSNAAVGHIFNSYISSGPTGGGGSGMTSILAGTADNGVFRGVILSESNVFALGNNNRGRADRTQFTCTAGADVGNIQELSDGTDNGYINSDNLSLYSGHNNDTEADTYRACLENFNNPKAFFNVPYSYQKMPTDQVFEYVSENAGVK